MPAWMTACVVVLLAASPATAFGQGESQDSTADSASIAEIVKLPDLKDRKKAVRIVGRHYPAELVKAGIGGVVNVWVFVGADGVVQKTQLGKSSGNRVLDEAAREAIKEFEFTPAVNDKGDKVAAWVGLPITFTVR